jgi:CheY-like chemotaxis protein
MSLQIARTLAQALTDGITTPIDPVALGAARDGVQLLGLRGLDRVLAACLEHAGRPLPADFEPAIDRIRRLAHECQESGSVTVFEKADRDLAALAAELEGQEWSESGTADAPRPAVATLRVADALDDIALAGEDSRTLAQRLRVTAPVAAALRAALDWLAPAAVNRSGVRLYGEPSLLEVRLEAIDPGALEGAQRVIAAAGGNLGPVIEPDGRLSGGWMIRVPTFAPRATYLMVEQGPLRLALPWHSVLRIAMVPAASLRDRGHVLDAPVLGVLAPSSPSALEHPLVLIGHGVKRAYLMADRLVWRLMADPQNTESPSPSPKLDGCVRTEEGESYCRLDPARALESIETQVRWEPARAAQPRRGQAVLTESDVEPLPSPASAPAPVVDSRARAASTGEPASPDASSSGSTASATAIVTALPTPPAASPTPESKPAAAVADVAPARPRVLVADDSLTARLFLGRMLDKLGVEVETVPRASALLARLGEPWSLVVTDCDLPDASGVEWLLSVRDQLVARSSPAKLAVLIRDGADLDVARAAGIDETLLKPFDRASVAALLERAGLGGASG